MAYDKAYYTEYRRKNRARVQANQKAWREANRARLAERDRQYYEEHREVIKQRSNEWYYANKEAHMEATRRRRKANPQLVRDDAKRWRENNPEKRRVSVKKWADANPDRVRENARRSQARRRARLRNGHSPGVTREQWEDVCSRFSDGDTTACAYCPQPATSIDHVLAIVNGGLDEPDNVVPACKRCNSSKGPRVWPYQWAGAGGARTVQDFLDKWGPRGR